MKIDLNADLGEGCASDAELLTLVPLPYCLWFYAAMPTTAGLRA